MSFENEIEVFLSKFLVGFAIHICTSKRDHKTGIYLPKLFWPTTVRKNCSSDREKLLKFKAEGREFAKCLRSLEQFIQTVGVFFCDCLDLCYDLCHVIKHES